MPDKCDRVIAYYRGAVARCPETLVDGVCPTHGNRIAKKGLCPISNAIELEGAPYRCALHSAVFIAVQEQ